MDSSITEFGHISFCKQGYQCKINTRMVNSVDPDETAHHDQSHLAMNYCNGIFMGL